jgi:phosphoglycerate dehydrogenase-like enzyme
MSMASVNVVVTHSLDDECQRLITAISPRIRLWDVSDLVRAEQNGDFTAQKQLDALLAEAEVVYGFDPPGNLIARAPKLKWIQAMVAGVDYFLDADVRQSPVVLTNFPHGAPVSEFALQLMLMLAKQASVCFRLKQAKKWERFKPPLLGSKTVGILGLGNVGQGVARSAKALGMRVIAMEIKQVARPRYVDLTLPPEQLPELLSASDFVVITLPLTPETNKLIGEAELRTMKSTAYLINVARGNIVDEEALIRALDEHWIAGAGNPSGCFGYFKH